MKLNTTPTARLQKHKQFPKTTSEYPFPGIEFIAKRIMAYVAVADGNVEDAESLILPQITNGMENYLIFPNNSHIAMGLIITVVPILAIYKYKMKCGEDIAFK